jgi:hypothetical protein
VRHLRLDIRIGHVPRFYVEERTHEQPTGPGPIPEGSVLECSLLGNADQRAITR